MDGKGSSWNHKYQ